MRHDDGDGDPAEGPDAEDLRLWARACDGDSESRDSLAELVSESAGRWSRVARLRCDDAEEIESRMQASVWELMRVGRSVPRSSLRGWLRYRFLAVAKQFFRERKKVQSLASILQDGDAASPHASPSSSLEQSEFREALNHCLGRLPESHRQAVSHRLDYTPRAQRSPKRDLSKANQATIRVWIHRGMLALQECLQARGVVA